jgi:hypothetical protein
VENSKLSAKYSARRTKFQQAPTFSALEELETQSDRSAAIVASALLEDQLAMTIEHAFIKLNESDVGSLFQGRAVLGTFSSKILVGYAIGLYGPQTRKDIEIKRASQSGCRLPETYLISAHLFVRVADSVRNQHRFKIRGSSPVQLCDGSRGTSQRVAVSPRGPFRALAMRDHFVLQAITDSSWQWNNWALSWSHGVSALT